MRPEHAHGNRISTHRPGTHQPDVRKVVASTVPYGENITTHGGCVWCAYDEDGQLIVVAATAREARRKYRDVKRDELRTGGGQKC